MAENIKFLSDRKFKEALNKGENGQCGVLKGYTPDKVKVLDEKQRIVDFIISTEAIDRMGDRIFVDGWDLSAFKKNPIVLFAHDSNSPPIGRAVSIKRDLKKSQLKSRAEFMTSDISPFADSIFKMIVGGFLKATSVGFMPIEFEISEEEERMDGPFRGIDFVKSELMEFSIVPIPANREAVIDAGRKGIDLSPINDWAELVLDKWEEHNGLCVPRGMVENLYKDTTKEKPKTFFRVDSKKKGEIRKENLKRLGVLSEGTVENEDDKMPDKCSDTVTLTEESELQVSQCFDLDVTEEVAANPSEEVVKDESDGSVDEIPEEIVEKDVADEDLEVEVENEIEEDEGEDEEEKGVTIGEDQGVEEYEVNSFSDSIELAVSLVDQTLDYIDSEDGKSEFRAMMETRSGVRRLNYINDTFKELVDVLDELLSIPFTEEETVEEDKSADATETSKEVDEVDDVVIEFEELKEDKGVEPEPEEVGLTTDDIVSIIKEHVSKTVKQATDDYFNRRRGRL
jgi:HK97 family phage prohead protease